MPRTQSLARDFDPAFDHLTEVTGFGSNPGALRMFEYVPADLCVPKTSSRDDFNSER
jgi:hypothetical protein